MIVELHGDWRTFARLYGSPLRRAAARVADAVGGWAVRHAAKVRTRLPVHVAARARGRTRAWRPSFPRTWTSSRSPRPVQPLPEQTAALFVGVLEPYKNIDGLAAAWRRAKPRVPDAGLRLVG